MASFLGALVIHHVVTAALPVRAFAMRSLYRACKSPVGGQRNGRCGAGVYSLVWSDRAFIEQHATGATFGGEAQPPSPP